MSITFKVTERYGSYATISRKKLVYRKPHSSMPRLRVSRYGLKTFLGIFWNSSLMFFAEDFENYPNGKIYKAKCCFLYGKTLKHCGRRRLQDIIRKHMTNQRKTGPLYWIVKLIDTHCIVPTGLQTMCINFVLSSTS